GLQVDLPRLGKPFGFPVDHMWILRGKKADPAFEAPAGSLIEVELPPEHPELPLGAIVYCSSSQAVKRRYRHERPKPGRYRARHGIHVELRLTENTLTATGHTTAQPVVEVCQKMSGPFPAAKDPKAVEQAARGAFEKLGDTSLSLNGLTWHNPGG